MGYCIEKNISIKPSLNPNQTNENNQKNKDNILEVLFEYEGQKIIIQSNIEDKMKDIINKFKIKINEEDNNLYYIYNGDKINEELEEIKLNQIIKDKNEKKIIILVDSNNSDKDIISNETEMMLNEIICPECEENILIKIKDYKINLYDCKNGHKKDNISLNDFKNIVKIDISKIKCNRCENKINDIYNNEFYICNECNMNLCLLCKLKHNQKHNIINYKDKNCICKKHNEKYIKYCKKCKENICFTCTDKHYNHNIIELLNIIDNKSKLKEDMKFMREKINKFKDNIKNIKNILNKILNNIEIYYKIFNNFIENYNFNNRNYENYHNLNIIKDSNNNIINELNNIINENNINDKLNNIIDIYYKIIKITKKQKLSNGNEYYGDFINNLKNGKGKLYYNNGNIYEGDFKDDVKEGKGKYYFTNGYSYKGDWKNDKREGKGILYLNDIKVYEGDWKYDKKEGKGIFYYNNGNIYEGYWKDDKREGNGIVYYKNGDRRMGNYFDDERIGLHVTLSKGGKVTKENYGNYQPQYHLYNISI